MRRIFLFLFVCTIANATEFTFENSESANLGLSFANIDSQNQYVLTGKIEASTSMLDASVKIFLGDFLIDEKDLSINPNQEILKLLYLSQEQLLSSEIFVDVDIPQGSSVIVSDVKITAVKDANLSQSEMNTLGLSNRNLNSNQSFAYVNGVNILDNDFSSDKFNPNIDSLIPEISAFEKFLNSMTKAVFFVDGDYGSDSFVGKSIAFDGFDGPKKTLQSALINSYAMPAGVISEIVMYESSTAYSSAILEPKAGEILIIRPIGTIEIRGSQLPESAIITTDIIPRVEIDLPIFDRNFQVSEILENMQLEMESSEINLQK